ncbi:VENN motif pre-toxin domain-containing protein [Neisseria yangbaofengii]|uniref:VENN motif pre-toxin domain-containing protein n=3 Tax=Neisseria yangbaofengii TaxID=2709396 RepID=UPI001D013D0A|nr:VENN motif pre-toxin domain-containing protein [Neisseria yangbaofengii]
MKTNSSCKERIENHSRYKGESFDFGASGGVSGKTLGQSQPDHNSRLKNVSDKDTFSKTIGYSSDSDSQNSVTKSGIGTRNIVIGNDPTGKQAEAVYTDTRSETAEAASGRLKNTFDKDKVQREIDLQRKVSQEFSKNVQSANSEINQKLDTLKEQKEKGLISEAEYRQKTGNWQKGKVLLNSIAAGLSAPTDSAAGIAAATASPAVSYQIGQYFKGVAKQNSDGNLTAKQETAHILAHAVLGAATAAAGDNNALAGAISAGSAEAAAPLIGNYLYGEKDGSKLTAEQKETVTAITNLLGTATGAVVGNTTTNAVQGSLVSGNAVENNSILSHTARSRLSPQSKILYDRIIRKGNFHTVEDFNYAYAQCPNKACQNAVVQAFQKERERFFTYLADEIKDGKQRELLIKEFAPVMFGENSLLGGRFGQAAAINWSGYQDGFLARFPDAWIEKDKIDQKTVSGMSPERAERSAVEEMLIPQAISAAIVGAAGVRKIDEIIKKTESFDNKLKHTSNFDSDISRSILSVETKTVMSFCLRARKIGTALSWQQPKIMI